MNLGNFLRHALAIAVAMLFILMAVAVYWNGLHGPFLLDDYSNLPQLDLDVFTAESVGNAILGNESGMLGRPVAVATFLFNFYFFDGSTFSFKLVNLIIHLISTFLVYKITRLLVDYAIHRGTMSPLPAWATARQIAVVVALIWCIHPLQVSTVLYVVQRMAQLSVLFTLACLYSYIKGRSTGVSGPRKAIALYLLVPLFAVLSILSKENGALIPLYLLAVELTIFRFASITGKEQKHTKFYFLTFVVLPICVGIAGFFMLSDNLLHGYEFRNFSLLERLLTEAMVLMFYLKLMVLPKLSDMSLYHDGFVIYRHLEPKVLVAIAGLSLLAISALVFNKRHALYALGIGIFFISHLLESTVIPLEIAFEHRNYLAVWGIILVGIALLGGVLAKLAVSRKMAGGLVALIGVLLIFQTFVRSSEWRDDLTMNALAVEDSPRSERARASLAVSYAERGDFTAAAGNFLAASKLAPTQPYYPLVIMQLNCSDLKSYTASFSIASQALKTGTIDHNTLNILTALSTELFSQRCEHMTLQQLAVLYRLAIDNPVQNMKRLYTSRLMSAYARMLVLLEQPVLALEFLQKAVDADASNAEALVGLVDLSIREGKALMASNGIKTLENTVRGKLGLHDEDLLYLRDAYSKRFFCSAEWSDICNFSG